MESSHDFNRELLLELRQFRGEVHSLGLKVIELKTQFSSFLNVVKEVGEVKKKIQEMEVEQAIHRTKMAAIGAVSGFVSSLAIALIVNLIKK